MATTQTLNNIKLYLNEIADNHAQIHAFKFGKLSDFDTLHLSNPAEMWCDYSISQKTNATIGYTIRIYILDLVTDGLENETEVMSDTALICSDIEAQLRNSGYPFQLLEDTITFNPVEEFTTYRWSGHYFDITFMTAVSDCGLPFIPQLTPPNPNPSSSCLPVSILNQNGDTIATVASGGTYTVEELTEIADVPELNTATIIDPLT